MVKYDVFCKGPFPDGRGHECWVQIGWLELPMTTDPRKHLSGYAKAPLTTLITVVGILSMFLPPFGMLLGKWIALEAAYRTGQTQSAREPKAVKTRQAGTQKKGSK